MATPWAEPQAQAAPTPAKARVVEYRVDVRVPDDDGFEEFLDDVMQDDRGWSRAGFDVRPSSTARHVVVLAEGDVVHDLCLPYDVGRRYSCQNGPIVAINAVRWRSAVPHWTSGLAAYRTMLLNHEMGHLLGQRHRPCPGSGPAPVMHQQSGGLGGCRENPWPLEDEIVRAARHDKKVAPEFGE